MPSPTRTTANKADNTLDKLLQDDHIQADLGTDPIGFTARELANEGDVSIHAARQAIRRALNSNQLHIIGHVRTGRRGRPAPIYGSPHLAYAIQAA